MTPQAPAHRAGPRVCPKPRARELHALDLDQTNLAFIYVNGIVPSLAPSRAAVTSHKPLRVKRQIARAVPAHHQPVTIVLDFVAHSGPRHLRRQARFDEAGGTPPLDHGWEDRAGAGPRPSPPDLLWLPLWIARNSRPGLPITTLHCAIVGAPDLQPRERPINA